MVDYQYSDLYKQDSVDKQIKITFDNGEITNSDLHQENFELTESICSDTDLVYGACEASMVKFRISNVFQSLKDKELTITEILNDNADNPFLFGKYKVVSDVPTADRNYRDITAYDKMYDIINADVSDWYNALLPDADRTTTVKAMRDSFMSHFGIEQEEVELINDSMVVQKTIQPTILSGKDVITAICEINGCFGHIARNGKFQYITLKKHIQGVYPSNDLYPADNLYPVEPVETKIDKSLYISCEYEDYLSHKIDRLIIRQEENDVGSTYPNIESGNTYIVQDNFLVYGKSSEELNVIASNLYSVISDTIYRPFKAKIMGNPCIEVGDAIRFNTKYEIVESYVLNRTLTGIQALRDNFSANGNEYFAENVNSVESKIIQLKSKTNTLERNVDETKSQIADVEQGLQSQITQTAESINFTVSKNQLDTSKWEGESVFYGTEDMQGITVTDEYADYDYYCNVGTGYIYTKVEEMDPNNPTKPLRTFWDQFDTLQSLQDSVSSQIEQTSSQIVLKIDKNGKIRQVALSNSAERGTEFQVDADNINMTADDVINLLANGDLNLTGKNIKITSDNFNVDKEGNMSAKNGNFSGTIFSGQRTNADDDVVGLYIGADGTFDYCWYQENEGTEGQTISAYGHIRCGSTGFYVKIGDTYMISSGFIQRYGGMNVNTSYLSLGGFTIANNLYCNGGGPIQG